MKAFFARTLVLAFPCVAMAQIAVLQIKVIEGEGAVHPGGAHVTRPMTVEVSDENGRPVSGAAVSFQLPADGPGGLFSNGLRTDLVITDAAGRAALHGMQLNRTDGALRVRITAVKEQARAGIVALQYIGGVPVKAEPPAAAVARISPAAAPVQPAAAPAKSGEITRTNSKMAPASHKKWLVIAAIAVAGGAAFLGVSRASKQTGNGTDSASQVSIGTPVITIGHP